MKSYFLFIELSGLQHFLKVEDSAAADFISNSRRIVSNVKKTDMLVQGSFIIFKIESDLSASQAVLESSVKVLENLIQHAEDFHEFSMMVIYRDSADIEKILGEEKPEYYTRCVDSAILVENQVYETSGLTGDDEAIPGFMLLLAPEPVISGNSAVFDVRLTEEAEVVKLIEMLIPEFENESPEKSIILKGHSDIILYCNLDAALVKAGSGEGTKPVVIHPLNGDSAAIMPFFRSIEPDFIHTADQFLTGIELQSWKNRAESLINVNSDYPEESFFITYCLYLKAKMKAFEYAGIPAVIIFDGLEVTSVEMLDYLRRVLSFLSSEFSPVIFFFENTACRIKKEVREHEVLSGAVEHECCSNIRLTEKNKTFQHILKRLLFVVQLTEGLFDSFMLNEFLTGFGYNELEIKTGLRELEAAGCLRAGRYPHLLKSRLTRELLKDITSGDDIYVAVAAFINNNLYKNCSLDLSLAAERLLPAMVNEEVHRALYGALTRLLDYGRIQFVRSCLSGCVGMPEELLSALRLRCALIEGQRDECIALLKNIPDKPESPRNWRTAALMLEISRYFHALSDYTRALDYVKKVLIYMQEEDAPGLEGTAFIELGFIMMCKGKLLESSEYMSLAVEKLLVGGDEFNLMKAYIYSAVGHYLWGSLDTALEYAERAVLKAAENHFENWYFFTEFFKCRMFFELGRYYDAEKLLSGCLLRNEIYRDEKRRKLFLAWMARACVYQGKVYRGLNMLKSLDDDPEVLMFLGEAYYFHGDLENAVENIEAAGSMRDYFTLEFTPLENIKWDNGFISVEDRALRSAEGTGVMLHVVRAMNAYFLGLSGDKEYGIEILFSLTRDQKISEYDPFNRLYFYFYCILYDKSKNTDIVDKLTLISKALKYLQQTSSRINTPSVRQEFMTKNYWNAKLVNEARSEKLI